MIPATGAPVPFGALACSAAARGIFVGPFFVLAPFGETDAFTADCPSAGVFAEPDFVGTWHCQISGQKSLERKARPQGLAHAALGCFFHREPEFGTALWLQTQELP